MGSGVERRRLLAGAALATGGLVAGGGGAWASDRPSPWHARSSQPRPDENGRSVRVLWRVSTQQRLVALTYDDGPSTKWTPRVLDMLAEHGVRVTFFLVGQRAAAHPQLVRRAAEAGHEFANHTWNHADLSQVSEEEADRQLRTTDELVRRLTGTRPRLMRPPWGRIDAVGMLAAARLGYTVALWSQLVLERQLSADRNVHDVVAGTGPGSMILVHDGGPVPNGRGLRAVPEIIDRLTRDGYRFVTVSQLIEAEAVEAEAAAAKVESSATAPPPRRGSAGP